MTFSHSFSFRPWRLFPDVRTRCWLVETRDPDTQMVQFYSLDNQANHITPLAYSGPWACGITEVYDGVAVIHGYENGGLPVRNGLWAMDTRTGDMLWSMPEGFSSPGSLPEGLIISHSMRPEALMLTDRHTGLPTGDAPADWQVRSRAFAHELVPEMEALPAEGESQGIRWGETEVWVEGNTVRVKKTGNN